MFRFFESIKYTNCTPVALDLHEARMNRTRTQFFGITSSISLVPLLKNCDPALQKCKIIYDQDIISIEFTLYQPRRINFLKIIEDDTIGYDYKYLDRRCFDAILNDLPKESDILIIKNGKVTDTSFSNVVFWDGKNWITPAEPLLAGTKRQLLLDEGKIHQEEIMVDDLYKFKSVKLINAMLDLEESAPIGILNII